MTGLRKLSPQDVREIKAMPLSITGQQVGKLHGISAGHANRLRFETRAASCKISADDLARQLLRDHGYVQGWRRAWELGRYDAGDRMVEIRMAEMLT